MSSHLRLNGVIRHIDYDPQVRTGKLARVDFSGFDINAAPGSGIVEFDDEVHFAYSKWVTPKPSRSFPLARIYRTYHLQTKRVTVIPILKDEGKGTQNNDRFTYMAFSRMNLMDVYIILAWYDYAEPHESRPNAITNQSLNNSFVVEKLNEIRRSQKSAMHWNELHFERDFADVYRRAVESYQKIGHKYNLVMNSAENHLSLLDQYLDKDGFSLAKFAQSSSRRSASAALREALTVHDLEVLTDGVKAYLELKNRLGGIYHVTADEVYWEDGILVIQESKNSSTSTLPSLNDIQDGLFKNILFKDIAELYLDGNALEFSTRLKLTGKVEGNLRLPEPDVAAIEDYASHNGFKREKRRLLLLMNQETLNHEGLSIEIASNR